ncbi:MAG: hypothetical protein HYU80_04035 [Candidatus Blackburnbacteria bacterium]|nr:hypothetical protein [Candidatus Blackburnbacteria bacterium]
MLKLNAKELRGRKPTEEELASIKRRPIYIVLDNVLDTYNIGGLFRLADSVAASQVILCGQSETPPSSRIHKAAVGTEEWVAWRYSPTALEYLQEFKIQNSKCKIVAVEQSKKSISYTEIDESPITNHPSPITHHSSPIAVVVGHETEGVSKDVLDVADVIVELPMFGVNKSLNVIVSAAIVLYKILEQWE